VDDPSATCRLREIFNAATESSRTPPNNGADSKFSSEFAAEFDLCATFCNPARIERSQNKKISMYLTIEKDKPLYNRSPLNDGGRELNLSPSRKTKTWLLLPENSENNKENL